jgi:hypothetical protein
MIDETQDTPPLIDLAREFVEAARAHEITDARLNEARARAYALGMTSQFDAEFYVRGYDAGVDAGPRKWEAHTRQVQQANDRLRARIAELEAQLAARPVVITDSAHYPTPQPQQQPTGIVVDYAMRERAAVACYEHISVASAHRVHEWWLHVLTAALTSATTVPLANAIPWDTTMDGSPLYLGLAQPVTGVNDA